MTILYVLMYPIEGNSSANISNVAIIKGLITLGHSISILCPQYAGTPFDTSILDKVYIYRCNSKAMNTNHNSKEGAKVQNKQISLLRAIAKKIYYCISIFDTSTKMAKNVCPDMVENRAFDLIISASDPATSHLAAKALKQKGLRYGKWIQYWGDPLTDDITRNSRLPRKAILKIEERLISSADAAIYVSPLTLQLQQKNFEKYAGKLFFLPPPYLEGDNEDTLSPELNGTVPTIGYYGAYNSSIRNIMPLYNACKNLGNFIKLEIVGNSDLELSNTANIKIYQHLSYRDVQMMQDKCSALVCITNNRGTQIPAKIYYSAATTKPVFVLVDGEFKNELSEYLASYNRFIICDNTEDSIATAIKQNLREPVQCQPILELTPERIAKRLLSLTNCISSVQQNS